MESSNLGIFPRQTDTWFAIGCVSLATQKSQPTALIFKVVLNISLWEREFIPVHSMTEEYREENLSGPDANTTDHNKQYSITYASSLHQVQALTHILSRQAKTWVYPSLTGRVQPRDTRWLSWCVWRIWDYWGHVYNAGQRETHLLLKVRVGLHKKEIQVRDRCFRLFLSTSFSIALLSLVSLEAIIRKADAKHPSLAFLRDKSQIPTRQRSGCPSESQNTARNPPSGFKLLFSNSRHFQSTALSLPSFPTAWN